MPGNGLSVSAKVELSGDFFRRDPGKTFRANVRDMNDDLAAWMEAEVKGIIGGAAPQMDDYTGWSHGHVVGRTSSNGGNRWGAWAVVSANSSGLDRKDAVRTKAAAAEIERRWHPYRRVKSGVYRSRAVITANLTAGLE